MNIIENGVYGLHAPSFFLYCQAKLLNLIYLNPVYFMTRFKVKIMYYRALNLVDLFYF